MKIIFVVVIFIILGMLDIAIWKTTWEFIWHPEFPGERLGALGTSLAMTAIMIGCLLLALKVF